MVIFSNFSLLGLIYILREFAAYIIFTFSIPVYIICTFSIPVYIICTFSSTSLYYLHFQQYLSIKFTRFNNAGLYNLQLKQY